MSIACTFPCRTPFARSRGFRRLITRVGLSAVEVSDAKARRNYPPGVNQEQGFIRFPPAHSTLLELTRLDREAATGRCSATTCAVALPADSRVPAFGSSIGASLCQLPQTNAECRVPRVRRPSPGRPVVQSALSLRTGASQMMGGATLQPCVDNFSWQ